MSTLGVLADDFTGASDVGVQFKKFRMETIVLTRLEKIEDIMDEAEVIVIDTESRNDAFKIAYNKVEKAVKALKRSGIHLVYKKIDSTVRGNLGAELDAVLNELDIKAVIVAPAFPANKRTTVNGRQLINNIPLEMTEFARDPINPAKESHIKKLIQNQTHRRVSEVNLSTVRRGVQELRRKIQHLTEKGNEIIIIDAEYQDDLQKIAKVIFDCGFLPCGSAGLAEEISKLLSLRRTTPVLTVSGSINPVTLTQISKAGEELGVCVLELDFSNILTCNKACAREVKRLLNKARKALAEGRDIVIAASTSKKKNSRLQQMGRNLGMSNLQVARRVLSIMSEAFRRIINGHKFSGLILVGGDTAIAMINAMNAYGIRMKKEVFSGVPLGEVIGRRYNGMRIITKAGGFGEKNTLVEAIRCLKGNKEI